MCSIIGVAPKLTVSNRAWLAAGCDSVRHRGQGDAGQWRSAEGCVGLGHCCLSSIDLSLGGHQACVGFIASVVLVLGGALHSVM
jgi:hypothetical protein